MLLMLSLLGSFDGDPIRQCIHFCLHAVGFRKGRSQLRLESQLGFRSGPRSENCFGHFSIPGDFKSNCLAPWLKSLQHDY